MVKRRDPIAINSVGVYMQEQSEVLHTKRSRQISSFLMRLCSPFDFLAPEAFG